MVDKKETSATDKAKSKAYTAATARLRALHSDEFRSILAEEYATRGLEYKARPTAREKAEIQMKALLAEYPDLRTQI